MKMEIVLQTNFVKFKVMVDKNGVGQLNQLVHLEQLMEDKIDFTLQQMVMLVLTNMIHQQPLMLDYQMEQDWVKLVVMKLILQNLVVV